MKIGAVYPQTELGGDPAALHRIGTAADALGYAYLAMFDHVLGATHESREPPLWGPYTERDPFHDPLVSFAYLAGVTQRIEFVTGILVAPQRQTALLARQAADLDLLSGGRFRLGLGIGWNYVEYRGLGADFATRGQRLSEQIAVLRQLWAQPLVDFSGRFHELERVSLNPRPAGTIAIYLGGYSDPALRRAARLADGFIFGGPAERVLPAWDRLKRFLAEQGRDPAGFGADWQLPRGLPDDELAALVDTWRTAGGSHVGVQSGDLGFTEAGQHLAYFERMRDRLEIVPAA